MIWEFLAKLTSWEMSNVMAGPLSCESDLTVCTQVFVVRGPVRESPGRAVVFIIISTYKRLRRMIY